MKGIARVIGTLALCLPACAHTHTSAGPAPAVADWAGTLLPTRGSSIRAAVAARSGLGETGISITIAGAAPGSARTWRVGTGTCDEPGPPISAVGGYPALRVNSVGNASASARLRIALAAEARYHVSVYESPARTASVSACGAIRPTRR